MAKPKKIKLTGPIRRPCHDSKNSVTGCDIPLYELDWSNWWTDNSGILRPPNIYIHVRKLRVAGECPMHDTWHRVYPKKIAGRKVTRLAVEDGYPVWLHDRIKGD